MRLCKYVFLGNRYCKSPFSTVCCLSVQIAENIAGNLVAVYAVSVSGIVSCTISTKRIRQLMGVASVPMMYACEEVLMCNSEQISALNLLFSKFCKDALEH